MEFEPTPPKIMKGFTPHHFPKNNSSGSFFSILHRNMKSGGGFTLVDVLVGTFLMLIVFLGIFGVFQLGIKIIFLSKSRIEATAIAKGEIEVIRNLPYGSIGVDGSFPDGILEAETDIARNQVSYNVQRRVDFIIDSTDGVSSPEDECPNDYKKVEIKVAWQGKYPGEAVLVTDIAPKDLGQECEIIGGVIFVSVFNVLGQMVDSPLIEIKDIETEEVLKTATPLQGEHYFSLEPNTYKIVVSKDSFSTEQTYGTDEIAIPEKPHPIVLQGQVTEISFSIDKLSTFLVNTFSPLGTNDFYDSFLDTSKIALSSNVIVAEEEVKLVKTNGTYFPEGYLISNTIEPADIVMWGELSYSDNTPTETKMRYQVLYFDGENWVLVPNRDLPGNSAGLAPQPINLKRMDPTTYPKIRLKATFFSLGSEEATPILYNWQVNWKTSQGNPVANITFDLRGEKIIGYDVAEDPVYKYLANHTSGVDGTLTIANLEWDSYTFSVDPTTGLNLTGIQPAPQPIGLSPDITLAVDLYLEAENSLLVTIKSAETSAPIFGAEVRLYNIALGYDSILETNEQGQAFFIPLKDANYLVEVIASGYNSFAGSITVSGDTSQIIELERIE